MKYDFGLLLYSQMYRYHLMHQASSIEPQERMRAGLQVHRLAQLPNFRSWWRRQRQYFEFDPGFCKMVDEHVRAAESGAQNTDSNPDPEPAQSS